MKTLHISILFLFLFAGISLAVAQPKFSLKLDEVSRTSSKFVMKISMCGDGTFGLGNCNLVFDFDPALVEKPVMSTNYRSIIYNNIWSPPGVTEKAAGKADFHLVLLSGTGDAISVMPSWIEVAEITFDVLDPTASLSFSWLESGTSETVVYRDDFTRLSSGTLTGLTSSAILPVTWNSFDVMWQDDRQHAAHLLWSVTDDGSLSHFVVERSSDAGMWEKIGSISGDQGQVYSFQDHQPLDEVNYYRIRIVDLNGNMNLSEIETLRKDASLGTYVKAWPNPFKDEITVEWEATPESITLLDIAGRQLPIQTLDFGGKTEIIGLDGLAPGVYFLNVATEEVSKTVRLVKE